LDLRDIAKLKLGEVISPIQDLLYLRLLIRLNYTFFYGAKTGGAATSLKYQDHLGYALQAGFDYMINERVGINFDVKKIFLKTNVQVNNAYTAQVRLDPWLIGGGVSYRF
jgi:outer membrane protein